MLRILLVTTLLATPLAAQESMDHSTMNHAAHMGGDNAAPASDMVAGMAMNMESAVMTEPGQGAFATIEEVVAALNADPMTDWSMVDIDGLREHLIDMDLVFTQATVSIFEMENGLEFIVSGEGRVTDAIQNMVPAHAGVMDGFDGWSYTPYLTADGATLEIRVPDGDRVKLAALGFFGIMAQGGHHQAHHWAMASGSNPHH